MSQSQHTSAGQPHADEYSQPGQDKLFEHEYDGIQEYDNPLPGWWKNIFWATFLFSIGYLFYFHLGGSGASVHQEHSASMAAWQAGQDKIAAKFTALPIDKQLAKALADPTSLAAGKALFLGKGTCWSCHAKDGGGTIGPNLADDYWINAPTNISTGPRLRDIFRVISEGGRPGKGMIPWKGTLTSQEMLQLTIYVSSLRGTKPAKPKPHESDSKKYNYVASKPTP